MRGKLLALTYMLVPADSAIAVLAPLVYVSVRSCVDRWWLPSTLL